MSDRFTKIPVADLRLGVFVAELDRPWLETPFLIQGFLLRDVEQLEILSELCQHVYIDVGKSHAIRRSKSRKEPLNKSIKETFSPRRLRTYVDSNPFDNEIATAKDIYLDYEKNVAKLYGDAQLGNRIDISNVSETVSNIVDSIIRNPDACTLLQKMRRKGDNLYNHAIGTSIWSTALSRQIGLPPVEIKKIAMGALLCDLGKVKISSRILDKPGKLSENEYGIVKAHTEIDDELRENYPSLANTVTEIIAAHHERHDGSGYPRGLKKDEIPVYARIVSIADCYDAMTHDRPYAKAMSPSEASKELYELRDIHFQGEIVEEFIQAAGLYPVGTLVELTTGEVGVVIAEYRTRRLRPKLLMLLDKDKQQVTQIAYLDLMKTTADANGGILEIIHCLQPGTYGLDPDDFFQ